MTTETEPELFGEFTRENLQEMLAGAYVIYTEKNRVSGTWETLSKPFRAWLDKHPEEVLRDGETGIQAAMQGGGEEHLLDFEHLRDHEDATGMLWMLADRGLLRLDYQGFIRQEQTMQHGSTVRRFIYETPRTRRFRIWKEG